MALSQRLSQSQPVLLVGCGRMGSALARGWIASGLAPAALQVVEPAGRPPLPEGVRHAEALSAVEAALRPAAIVLAVKPQKIESVLPELPRFADAGPLLLSIAAGVPIARLDSALPAVVRAMPNLPAAIGKGISAAIANGSVKPAQRSLAEALLAAAGEVVWLEDESLMDAVTAVSGSGPAYLFALTEAVAAAGRAEGLPAETAERLARATMIGAAHLMEQSGSPPALLREQVTSPGGTTEAALEALASEPSLASLIEKAVAAAAARSRALAGAAPGRAQPAEGSERADDDQPA